MTQPAQGGAFATAAQFNSGLQVGVDYTPVLYHNMTTTPVALGGDSNNAGEYYIDGDVLFFHAESTASSSSSGGVGISLPVVATTRQIISGSCVLMGSGTNVFPASPGASSVQAGIAYMAGGRDVVMPVALSGGFNINCVSGNTLRATGWYRLD
jgi:hypothetical protein